MNKKITKEKRETIGKVVSTATKETVIVAVERVWRHPIYKKAVRRKIKLAAHVTDLAVKVGDTVRLVETRPMSKTKHYKVVGIV